MARQTTIFQIFVASPSDVVEERAILEQVITQLNQIWSRTLGLTFELLKWEKAVRPGFSSDPQAVINNQIGVDYDVFIGIFWGRLGTATPRAESGTLEEFDRAYSRFMDNGTVPEIMLYFKDAPIAPSKVNLDQLKGVLEFKQSLTDRGGLYSEFEDSAGFESSVRAHLSAIAQKFSQPSVVSAILPQRVPPSSEVEDGEELGYLDHIDVYLSKMDEMTVALEVINTATVKIGEQATRHTQELTKKELRSEAAIKQFILYTAGDLASYAEIIQAQVKVLSSSRIDAFNSLSSALSLRNAFSETDDEDLVRLRSSLSSMIDHALNARTSMAGLRESTDGLPPMSKELNKAKGAVVTQVDGLLAEIDRIKYTINNIIESIDRMLGD